MFFFFFLQKWNFLRWKSKVLTKNTKKIESQKNCLIFGRKAASWWIHTMKKLERIFWKKKIMKIFSIVFSINLNFLSQWKVLRKMVQITLFFKKIGEHEEKDETMSRKFLYQKRFLSYQMKSWLREAKFSKLLLFAIK